MGASSSKAKAAKANKAKDAAREGLRTAPAASEAADMPERDVVSAPSTVTTGGLDGPRAVVQSPRAANQGPRSAFGPAAAPASVPVASAKASSKVSAEPQPPTKLFKLEGAGGATAAEVDAYLGSVLGSSISVGLRSTTWTDRVRALEECEALLEARSATGAFKSDDEPRQLFDAVVTVMAKTLHEKLVPVYLPAVALLVKVFSELFLAKVPPAKTQAAVEHLAPPLVNRAGSSNQRAREESAHALTYLAASKRVGSALVCPIVMRPLANRKSPHAAAGRIELLHAIVLKAGIGAPGLALRDVLAFILPSLESASDKTRDAAQAVLREALVASAAETIAYIEEHQPSLVGQLKKRAQQRKGEMAAILCADESKENEHEAGLQVVGEAVSSGSRGKGAKLRREGKPADAMPNAVSTFVSDGSPDTPDGVRRKLNHALDEASEQTEVETFAVHPLPSAPKKKAFAPRHQQRQVAAPMPERVAELKPLPELPQLPELPMAKELPIGRPAKALSKPEWPFQSKVEDELDSILQEINSASACATAKFNDDDELDCILLAANRAVEAAA